MGVVRQALAVVRGVVGALRAFIPGAKEDTDVALQGEYGSSTPDLVFMFSDETAVPKIVTSFQRTGFIVQELEPNMFAFQCKYEILLQRVERVGWKRLTKSGELITFLLEARDEFENVMNERKFLTPGERLILVRKIAEEDEILRSLKPSQVTVIPPNEPSLQARLSSTWVFQPAAAQPLNDIRAYLGEEIAFYFAFLGVYTFWLAAPSALGIALYFHQSKHGFATIETFAYSVFLAIWTTLFLEHWKRREKTLGFDWGCLDVEEREVEGAQLLAVEKNDEIPTEVGTTKVYLGYLTSYLMIAAALLSGVFCMGFLLQLDTYANLHWRGQDWDGVWSLAVYAPQVLLSVTITFYKTMNKSLAVFTTRLEQRRSEVERREALVTKLVVFNFVNYYAALIHTAFVKRDLIKLRSTLMTLLVVQQIIGQITEVGVPLAKASIKYYFSQGRDAPTSEVKGLNTSDESRIALAARVKKEASLETYAGVFDDYLELWVQMGQVCLFSSVYPLAAFVAFLNNVVEIRTDAFKIVHASRRVVPNRKSGIGSWLPMFDFLGYAAVVTNISLVGLVILSSPERVADFETNFGLSEVAILLVLVGAEHILVLFKTVLSFLIPDMPEEVSLKIHMAAKREEAARMRSLEQRAKLRHIFAQFKSPEALKSVVRPANAKDEPVAEALIAFVTEQAAARTHAEAERDRSEREMKRMRLVMSGQSLGFVAVVINIALSVIGSVLLLSGGTK